MSEDKKEDKQVTGQAEGAKVDTKEALLKFAGKAKELGILAVGVIKSIDVKGLVSKAKSIIPSGSKPPVAKNDEEPKDKDKTKQG
ncbi:MAG TPA: hypothetical protein QF353_04840 [Gammaproteobacteria bacterium]|nr:hypothetical protein [Gammaproteobacteria bacterium]